MKIINKTPHIVRLNDGTEFPSDGQPARVSQETTPSCTVGNVQLFSTTYGKITNLPAPQKDTYYIVSGIVKSACPERADLLQPATNHPETIRCENGYIQSVPGFIQ